MSDPNTAPGEQPAPSTPPVPTPGEQPAVTDHSTTLETLDREQLGNMLFGEKKEPEAAPATTPAPATAEATPAVETPPATPEPGAQPATESQPDPEKEESSLRRLGLGGVPMSERKQLADAAEMIRRGEATTVLEALSKMGALPAAAPASEAPAPEATPAAPATPEIQTPPTAAELEATIAQLREQRDQADDDFNKPEVRRLTAQIEDTVGLLAQARIDAVSQRQTASTYQEQYISHVDAMEAKYAWATDESSPLYQILDDKITAARARNDEALRDPNFIMKFADQVAEFGKPAAVPPPPAPPAVPARIVGGGVAPGHSDANQPTAAEASALVHNASKEALAAALFGAG